MSTLIVNVSRVEDVIPHQNADKLEIVRVMGWHTATTKGKFKAGDKCVFFPPDSQLTPPLAEKLGVAKYLGTRGRVKACRLRGTPSYGFAATLDEAGLQGLGLGDSVIECLGITKWEPKITCTGGDATHENPAFHRYTDIENINNFPHLILPGEAVYLTEKVHGTSWRAGYVKVDGVWQIVAGSHRVQRTMPDDRSTSLYWRHVDDKVEAMLRFASWKYYGLASVVFGEVFGLQGGMRYGMENGHTGMRAFDLAAGGRYLDFDEKQEIFEKFGVETVPLLYRGAFCREVVEQHTYGDTTLGTKDKFTGREGCVVGLQKEAYRMNIRCVLKSINADYLSRGDIDDGH